MISWIGGKLPANTGHIFLYFNFPANVFQVSNTHIHIDATIEMTPSMRHYRTSLPAYLIIVNKEGEKKHEHILFVPNIEIACTTLNASAHSYFHRKIEALMASVTLHRQIHGILCHSFDCLHGSLVIFHVNKCASDSTKSNGVSEWENLWEFENFGKSICTMNSNVFFIQIKYSNMVNKFTQNPKYFNA